ncbi:DNA repair protein complementing XP-C cells-like [Symsagittifera roscoffensis]|uniref:DNA repair protein complementing XP-C cells-like n=1 Tax=Symsagittifera roscoffensis TaxID=84072 RepID=UPI00307C1066
MRTRSKNDAEVDSIKNENARQSPILKEITNNLTRDPLKRKLSISCDSKMSSKGKRKTRSTRAGIEDDTEVHEAAKTVEPKAEPCSDDEPLGRVSSKLDLISSKGKDDAKVGRKRKSPKVSKLEVKSEPMLNDDQNETQNRKNRSNASENQKTENGRLSRKSKINAVKCLEKSAKLEAKATKSEYFSDADDEDEKMMKMDDLDSINESTWDSGTDAPKKKKKKSYKISKKDPVENKKRELSKSDQAKTKVKATTGKKKSKKSGNLSGEDSNSEEEWEEIEGVNKNEVINRLAQMKSSQDVTVVIEKDKDEAFRSYVGQVYRKNRKLQQIGVLKAYLMCFCAAGRYRNEICNSPLLQSLVFSLIPKEHQSKPLKSWNVESLKLFDSWFGKVFKIKENLFGKNRVTIESMSANVETRNCNYYAEFVMIFVCALRSLGFQCRLTWNCQKPPAVKSKGDLTECERKVTNQILAARDQIEKEKKLQETKCVELKEKSEKTKTESGQKESNEDDSEMESASEPENSPEINPDDIENMRALLMQTENYTDRNSLISSDLNKCNETTSSYFKEENVKVDKNFAKTGKMKPKSNKKEETSKVKKASDEAEESEIDSQDFGINLWCEVYLAKEQCWIPVSPVDKIYNKPYVLEKQAQKPVSYVFSFDNQNRMKDVTKRYALRWGSVNQKTRLDWIDKHQGKTWYSSLCKLFAPLEKTADAKEDIQIQDQMANMPIPGTVAELKDHPLYVLERHLLKFEVLHPKTAPVLGYVRNEPVFSRKCVKICHTEQTWMKEGMSIKEGEEAVKYVRPLISKFKLRKLEGQEVPMVGLFGDWQVELYKSPPVVDGRIPRNEYNNVNLFKMHMLPPGSVYLDLPGLDKVAKELDVDCVPAMRGWDFSGFHARPVLEGFVVCAENEDLLREFWQEKRRAAEAKVRETRAIGNWKKVVKALRIKEIIRRKYEYSEAKDKAANAASAANNPDDFEEL